MAASHAPEHHWFQQACVPPRHFFVVQPDQVAERPRAREHLLSSWRAHLSARQLHHRAPVVTNQLVCRVEVRVVGRHAHPRADAESVDEGAIAHELVDGKLIEATAREDAHFLQAGLIEKRARASRKSDQVTAVDSYSKTAGEVELL